VQATDLGGDTRLFYQNADNSIQQTGIHGAFNIGTFTGTGLIVPAQEVVAGTPIAAALISPAFTEVNMTDDCLRPGPLTPVLDARLLRIPKQYSERIYLVECGGGLPRWP
jgi:hypothetical protein